MPPQGGGAQPPYFWGPLPTSASASMRTRPFTLSCFPEGKVHWLVARAGGGTGTWGSALLRHPEKDQAHIHGEPCLLAQQDRLSTSS